MSTVPTPYYPKAAVRPPFPELPTRRNADNYFLPMHVSSRFGARLREMRQQRKWTQLRVAVDFGIDRTFISDIERGRKSVSLPTLEIFALGFKVSLSELLKNL